MLKSLFIGSLLVICNNTYSQPDPPKGIVERPYSAGIHLQAYPAGMIRTIAVEIPTGQRAFILMRAGMNFANRKDFSPYNDNEVGQGVGGTLGYRLQFYAGKGSVKTGLNFDIWNMRIQWKNDIGKSYESQGHTFTMVAQPWVDAGYYLPFAQEKFEAFLGLGFGREINAITLGKIVAADWMGSVFLGVSARL